MSFFSVLEKIIDWHAKQPSVVLYPQDKLDSSASTPTGNRTTVGPSTGLPNSRESMTVTAGVSVTALILIIIMAMHIAKRMK